MLRLLLLLALGVLVEGALPGFSNYRYGKVLTQLQDIESGKDNPPLEKLRKIILEGQDVVDQLRFGTESHLSGRAEQAEALDTAVIRVQERLTKGRLSEAHPNEDALKHGLAKTTDNNLELERMNHELSHALGLQEEEIQKKGKMRKELKLLVGKIRSLRHRLATKRRKLTRAFEGHNPKVQEKEIPRIDLMLGEEGILKDIDAKRKAREAQRRADRKREQALQIAMAKCADSICVLKARVGAAQEKQGLLKAQNGELLKAVQRATGIANEDISGRLLKMEQFYAKLHDEEKLMDAELANQILQNKQDAWMQQRLKTESEKQALLDSAPDVDDIDS